MDGQLTIGKYPDKIRRVIYWDEENKRKFIFFTSAFAEDERLQMASVSLTETLPLDKLFSKPNYNIVNELDESGEPTLF